MRVKDYVAKSINKYPFLYYGPSYEAAKFSILHQTFIVLGNGLEWAHTEDPSEGGYLTEGTFYKDSEDEWVRGYDPAYGTVTAKLDSRFWKEEMYCLSEIESTFPRDRGGFFLLPSIHRMEDLFESEIKSRGILQMPHVFIDCIDAICGIVSEKEYDPSIHTHVLRKMCRPGKGSKIKDCMPYPNFSKNYSCFWEIDPHLIQKDWLHSAIAHLMHWREYFSDPDRYKFYKGLSKANEFREYIESSIKKKYPESWIEQIRGEGGEYSYGFKEFDGQNYDELAEFRNNRSIDSARKFINETLGRLNI